VTNTSKRPPMADTEACFVPFKGTFEASAGGERVLRAGASGCVAKGGGVWALLLFGARTAGCTTDLPEECEHAPCPPHPPSFPR
jgi:hypothetical protein